MSNMKSETHCDVFVYGTLKPEEANYVKYCAGKTIAMQRAIAFGELFALPMGYPAMTISDRSIHHQIHHQIHGYLLSFKDEIILESLDELEDYQSDRLSSENLYDRQQIEIFDLTEKSLGLAWVYIMTTEQAIKFGGIVEPDGHWRNPSKAKIAN